MTALTRVREWFVAPPPLATDAGPATDAWPAGAVPHDVRLAAPSRVDGSPLGVAYGDAEPGGAGLAAPSCTGDAPRELPVTLVVTSAAVLGRAGEVEPVAAALALALRREARAKAAAVVVVGAVPAEVVRAGGGSAAARRLAARLDAHGLQAHVRGRLAWVGIEPGDPHLVTAARRAALVAAPAVLAIAAPRTGAIDAALAEHDLLVVVTTEPDGPLARLAAAGLPGIPAVSAAPLSRGPVRALARAGLRSAGPVRQLLARLVVS